MLQLIWGWIIKHWSVVALTLILSWLTVGCTWLFFFRPTTQVRVGHGGTYVAPAEGLQPTFGCAISSQYIGWAHQKAPAK